MPQQINLCSPLQVAPKQIFMATTLAQALGLSVVVCAVVCGAWVWNLKQTSAGFAQTLQSQSRDINNLKAALDAARADVTPVGPAMQAQLQLKRTELARRESLRAALQEGMSTPGMGHSDRLALVARSIPQPAWITGIKADSRQFEVSGFTLEPAVLNDWVSRLAASPLLQGLKLSNVRVENASPPGGAAARPVWSFRLLSEQPVLPPVTSSAVSATTAVGAKP